MARLLLENLKVTEHNFFFFFDKYYIVSPPPLSAGGQLSVPNFEKGGSEKKESLGDLKSSYHGYLPGGAYYVSCQKKTFKNKIWI